MKTSIIATLFTSVLGAAAAVITDDKFSPAATATPLSQEVTPVNATLADSLDLDQRSYSFKVDWDDYACWIIINTCDCDGAWVKIKSGYCKDITGDYTAGVSKCDNGKLYIYDDDSDFRLVYATSDYSCNTGCTVSKTTGSTCG